MSGTKPLCHDSTFMAKGNGTRATARVGRVMVATDRSETADRAVRWAAALADRYDAELLLLQVILPSNPGSTESGQAEATRAAFAAETLKQFATEIAGARGRARIVTDDDPARAILRVAEEDIVNTSLLDSDGRQRAASMPGTAHAGRLAPEAEAVEPRLMGRATRIASVMAKHGLKELFKRADPDTQTNRRRQAERIRSAMEELGPTFAKLGQILSTRPDLLPPEFIEELATLQDNVPPLTEAQVVRVMEEELGVPWEDVFETIDAQPLAAGTIAQVHRATLADHTRAVVKVQRPDAKEQIEQDLALLEVFAEKVADRPGLKQVVDMQAVFEHLSESL